MTSSTHQKTRFRASKTPLIPFGSRTDIGCIRDHNEDSLVVTPPLFAVADGMGGHAAGEVASEIAVNILAEYAPEHPDGEILSQAVRRANHEIIRAAADGRGREGMGTTLTAGMIEGERLVIAQVGDSRAYLLHQNKLQQITRDHSLMTDLIEAGQITPEEARFHPQRSVITRALGSDPNLYPDIFEINVEAGDRLLICSDGLSGMLHDEEIEQTMCHFEDPQRCASQLVSKACTAGGHDNVTVIVADIPGFAEVRHKKMVRKSLAWIVIILALFASILAGAVWATQAYLNTVAYLTIENDQVVLYQGVPGTVLGQSFSELLYVSDITTDSLQPGTISNLESGLSFDSVDAAEAVIASYEAEIAALADADASEADSTEGSSEDEEA